MENAPLSPVTLGMITEHQRLSNLIHARVAFVGQTFNMLTKGQDERHWRGFYLQEHELWTHREVPEIYATFYESNQCGGDYEYVTFPASYLENDDWIEPLREKMERDKVAKKRAEEKAAAGRASQRAAKREAKELADYQRLQAKFGVSK